MINYKEEFKKARETGKVIGQNFKENPTYVMSEDLLKVGYCCPHCKQYDFNIRDEIIDCYITPMDMDFMCEHVEYSWTEDCKCGLCGGLYSRDSGC